MSAAKWILNLWPGLSQLWWRGTWQSLSLAVAFTALLNGALLVSLLEGVSWSPWAVVGLWMGVCIFALGSWLFHAFDPSGIDSRDTQQLRDQALSQAQEHYLKGHWCEAEKRVRKLLSGDPADAEARLLLVSILRRNGRPVEAGKQLHRLTKEASALHWHVEIEQEQAKLAAAHQAAAEEEANGKRTEIETATVPFSRQAA